MKCFIIIIIQLKLGLEASKTTREHTRTRLDIVQLGIGLFIKQTELKHFFKLV
jgi:hypothetical protein